jgi:DNA-binding winged helix-turn-helix (wHTH) protein
MTAQRYYFADFVLDPAQRQLLRGGQRLELNARYLDALVLLVQNAGKLVSKQRFFDEVWQGTVVSDEALTQCVRSLRRQLQDSAAAPRFIETVPKHGYRFIAAVSCSSPAAAVEQLSGQPGRQQLLWHLTGQGALGAAVSGLIGGGLYGLFGAAQALATGSQALSVLLVMLTVTTLIAILAGAAVASGLAAAKLLLIQPPGQQQKQLQLKKLGYLLLGGGAAGLLALNGFSPAQGFIMAQGFSIAGVVSAMLEAGLFTTGLTLALTFQVRHLLPDTMLHQSTSSSEGR